MLNSGSCHVTLSNHRQTLRAVSAACLFAIAGRVEFSSDRRTGRHEPEPTIQIGRSSQRGLIHVIQTIATHCGTGTIVRKIVELERIWAVLFSQVTDALSIEPVS